MDHIRDEDTPAVARAAHEVVQEAMNAGVWIFGGGLESQKTSIVATEGTVTAGPYPEAIGWVCVVDVPSRSGLPRTPAPAAARKKSGSSCPTRPWGTDGASIYSSGPAFRDDARAVELAFAR
jgi:hypothetical protein